MRKLRLYYKLIFKEELPAYLFQLILENETPYTPRKVQTNPYWRLQLSSYKLKRDLKTHDLIKSQIEIVPLNSLSFLTATRS